MADAEDRSGSEGTSAARRREAPPDPTKAQRYLGGKVQSMASDEQRRGTPNDVRAVLRRNMKAVRELGGRIEGRVVRIPPQYSGMACVDWFAHHGYRVVWS